jgi:hypothetical protein
MWRRGSWVDEAYARHFSEARIQTLERYAGDHPDIELDELLSMVAQHEIGPLIEKLLDEDERVDKREFMHRLQEFRDYVNLDSYWERYRRQAKNKPSKSKPPNPSTEDRKRRRAEAPGEAVNYGNQRDYLSGFKTKGSLMKNSQTMRFTNSFPLKRFKRLYGLHHVAPSESFMVDIAFFKDFTHNDLAFLILVNINTRKAYAKLINGIDLETDDGNLKIIKDSKSADAYLITLSDMILENELGVRNLKGDSEKAFISKQAREFYRVNEINFIAAPISFGNTNHSSLAIVDRLIRTIRDMQYNMGFASMTPQLMTEILNQYNSTPHEALGVAPNNMTPYLEARRQRKIKQQNYNIMTRRGFDLEPGTPVLAYNDSNPLTKRRMVVRDLPLRVVDSTGAMYKVVDESGNTNMVPRYKLRVAY